MIKGSEPAHLGHQWPAFLISAEAASHSCPYLQRQRSLALPLTYDCERHSPPRAAANWRISSSVNVALPEQIRHQLPGLLPLPFTLPGVASHSCPSAQRQRSFVTALL